MPMRLSSFLLLALLLITSGCAFLPEQIDETKDWSANQLYSKAKQELASKNYEKAIELFEKLEARYPFGQYAQQAQLEIAYAYYKYEEPELAVSAANRFIKIYPRHPNVDYAWYIKGLTNYNRGKVFIDRYLPQEPAERDTFSMRQSHDDFSQLVQRYPHSSYAKDAAQRMIHLRNNMAEYEIHVADYYIRRSAFVAASNRGKYVVENFQRTPAVEDALVVMVRAYRKLGVNDLADSSMRVLQLNYPNNADIAWLNDPRGYEVAKKGAGFWGGWEPWKEGDNIITASTAKKDEPSYWGNWKPWSPAAEAGEKEKQDAGQWEGYQYHKPATNDAAPAPSPAATPGTESEQWGGWKPWKPDPAEAKQAEEEPYLLDKWKFWEKDSGAPKTGTSNTKTGKQTPAPAEGTQRLIQDTGETEETGATGTDIEEQQPPFWDNWKFWEQETGTPATEASEQDSSLWEDWQQPRQNTATTNAGEQQPPFWEDWKFWEQEPGEAEAESGEAKPGFWESLIPQQEKPVTETGSPEQEPSLWEDWQYKTPPADETATGNTPSTETGAETAPWGGIKVTPWKPWTPDNAEPGTAPEAPKTEDSEKDPAFWEDLKFWEKDIQETGTPEEAPMTPADTNTGKEPAFWEDWKFWEKSPEEAPAGQ